MSRFILFVALVGAPILCGAPAHGQHLSPEQLDRLSQERQSEIGPRDWGTPPANGKAAVTVAKPTPVPTRCMSPAHDFEPLFQEPRASSQRVGSAAPQIAVTDDVQAGWRKVLRRGTNYAWLPDADVLDYRPLVPSNPTRCEVAGEGSDGRVLFTHPKL